MEFSESDFSYFKKEGDLNIPEKKPAMLAAHQIATKVFALLSIYGGETRKLIINQDKTYGEAIEVAKKFLEDAWFGSMPLLGLPPHSEDFAGQIREFNAFCLFSQIQEGEVRCSIRREKVEINNHHEHRESLGKLLEVMKDFPYTSNADEEKKLLQFFKRMEKVSSAALPIANF